MISDDSYYYAARLVTNDFDYVNSRGLDIVKSLKWMNVNQRCQYFTTTLMFKCIHGLAPTYLVDNIVMNCDRCQWYQYQKPPHECICATCI